MFKNIDSVLNTKFEGEKVNLRGWVYRKREQKKLIFIILRDYSNIIQGVIKADSKSWKEAQKITIESSCELTGTVHKDKRAPTGYEIRISNLKIIGLSEVFPITRDKSAEFLRDVRHLWIRSREITSILKVRSKVFEAIHEYFRKNGYYEYQSPILTCAAGESGSTQFEVKYFKEKAFLAQTWQLYAEAGIFALEKIYCIAPSFRAEKSITSRHLTEYWHAEVETAWQDFEGLQKLGEELISYVAQKVAKDCKKELQFLGKDPKEIAAIKPPFPRITYRKALELLKKDGMKVPFGKDLRTIEEKKICSHYKKPVIVTHYPKKVKAFYMKEDPEDKETVQGYDMLGDGLELIGASTREPDIKKIVERLKAQGENPKDYEFYLDTRRYGSIPHSGFGLGVERVVQWLTGIDNIRDTIAFPRTPDRIKP
ncbi:MAG: asparagine--tRNA ligase [Candidatus Woesearchaeota archaeon]|nr:MAG: asparagine--tRNA ligase [Candidatus Woesearchaeota archaeon]